MTDVIYFQEPIQPYWLDVRGTQPKLVFEIGHLWPHIRGASRRWVRGNWRSRMMASQVCRISFFLAIYQPTLRQPLACHATGFPGVAWIVRGYWIMLISILFLDATLFKWELVLYGTSTYVSPYGGLDGGSGITNNHVQRSEGSLWSAPHSAASSSRLLLPANCCLTTPFGLCAGSLFLFYYFSKNY